MQEDLSGKCMEFLDKQLGHVNSWLTFAEAKNAALIALNIAVIGVVFEHLSACKILAAGLSILFAASALFNLISFWPNDTSRPTKLVGGRSIDSLNLAFWGDIAAVKNQDQYLDLVISQYFPGLVIQEGCRKLFIDQASEIVINSRIAAWKYHLFKTSLLFDIIGIIIFCIWILFA